MKNRVKLIILVLGQHFFLLSGQDFAPVGAEWYYHSMAGGMAPSHSEYYHFVCAKDTIIHAHSLRKIDVTYYRYLGDSVVLAPYYFSQTNDTVSLYNPELKKFYTLYIFNANQGDTLIFDIPYDGFSTEDTTFRVVLDTVITEIYDSTPLKKYVLHPVDNFGWCYGFYLEKVGGYEWFLPLGLVIIPEVDGPVRCYRDHEVDIHFGSTDCNYRIVNSVKDLNATYLEIYPNPATGLVQVKSDFRIDLIEVIDDSGKKIFESVQSEIDISGLKKGIYLFRIITGNKEFIKKVVKQ